MNHDPPTQELPFGLTVGLHLFAFVAGAAIWFWTIVGLWEWLWPSFWFIPALLFLSWIPATLGYWIALVVATVVFGPLVAAISTPLGNLVFARFAIGAIGLGSGLALAFVLGFGAYGYFASDEESATGMDPDEGAYFESIDPILAEYAVQQDRYNRAAREADDLQSADTYARQVGAASLREDSTRYGLNQLESIKPPPRLGTFHDQQIRLFELTIVFCQEIQIAYDVTRTKFETDSAYRGAVAALAEIDRVRELLASELEELGYAAPSSISSW